MKDSGIEWIGEIPEDWEISKIKYVSDLNGRIGFRGYKQSDLVEEEHGAITLGPPNMDNGKLNLLNCKYLSWEKYYESPEIQLRVGDILLVKTASVGKVAYVDRLVKEMTINPQLLIIKSKNINNKFLFYVIFSEFFQSQVEMSVTGGTVPTLSQEKISNFEITNPPMTSQIKIAKYLDKMCFEVERISNKIKLEIENLESYKKSVITEAVTKGLDKNVEMKDSGIEWIGEIPKHWNVTYLKSFFDEGKNKNKLGRETNLLSLSYGEIIKKDINTQTGLLPQNFNKYNIVEEGSIIIRPTDLQNDKKSLRTGLVNEKGIITSAYINLKPKKNVASKYFHYLLHCYDLMKVFYNMGSGVRQGLTYSEFSKLLVLSPNSLEQEQIISYLDRKTKVIDETISLKQKQLETLEEYKKSLIYEYVTGKKEVYDGEES